MRRKLSALLAGLAVVAWAAADAAAVEIVPHRAYYAVSLAEASDVMESARGLAAVELTRDCDGGWRYRQRYLLDSTPFDGEPDRTDFTLDGQESDDGATYAFRSSTAYGMSEAIEIVGRAESTSEGGEVRFSEPVPLTRELPASTKFAVASVKAMLAAAFEGKAQIRGFWFVGATPEEPLLFSSVILPAEPVADAPKLLSGKRWRFVSAFFQQGEDAAPMYEGEETIVENGVMAGAVYRYEGYALRMELQRAEPVLPPDC